MKTMLLSVGALLISAAILLAGGGLLSSLVAVRAEIEGFPLTMIGLLLSGYYIGFVSGCLLTPHMVATAGHIRAFGALAALTAAASLMHAIALNMVAWMLLRVITGFCFAGLYMIIESWINERATNKMRGQVLAVYRIVDLVAVTAGQFMLTAANPAGFMLFSLVAILISLSIVPVAMTRAIAPKPLVQTSLNLSKLIKTSPFAVAGVLGVGLANGAFWGIAPVYVQQMGYDILMVASFMSAAIISGAIAQWPVGYISDLVDRRKVLIVVALGSVAGGVFLYMFGAVSASFMLGGGLLYGLFAMPLFALCAAHANDYAEGDEFLSISGGLLLLYGLGSIVGPVLAPMVMQWSSPSGLFLYTAIIHMVVFVFGVYRLTRRSSVPLSVQEDYVAVPRTTPAIFEIDPRNTLSDDVENNPDADPEDNPAP